MLMTIDNSEKTRITDLMNTFNNHRAVVEAIVNGNEEGCVFVDNRIKPASFFIYQYGGFFFLHGNPSNEFLTEISKHLYDELKLDCIEILISDITLEKAVPIIFGNRDYKVFQRKVLRIDLKKFYEVPSIILSEDYRIKIQNTEKTLQVTMKHKKEIISKCRAIIGNQEMEMSIETTEKYRRKGYATWVTRELISHALKRKMIPVWSCWTFNDASLGLAEKLGFEEIELVNVYLWDKY